MCEIALEACVDFAVKALHDSQVGALPLYVDDQVEENEGNAESFIPEPFESGEIELEGLSVGGCLLLADRLWLRDGLADRRLLDFDDLLLKHDVLLLHSEGE